MFEFWEVAMTERYRVAAAVLRKVVGGSVPAYDDAVEVQTLDRLRRLDEGSDGMWMQTLLVWE